MPVYVTQKSPGNNIQKVSNPMILSIYTEGSDTLVKVNFSRFDEGVGKSPMAISNFGVTKKQGRLKLQSTLYLNSRHLQKQKVGNISYYYPEDHEFSMDSALRMQAFNEKLAEMFQRDPIEFRYFVSRDNLELNKLMGYDFKFDMFNMNSGNSGLSDPLNRIIYAGNGSEFYPHELVHLYTYQAFPKHHSWFDEGFATYLGGSRGMPLDWHISALHKYLADNGYPDLYDPFALPPQLTKDTATIYVIGGLITKLAYETCEMDSINHLFLSGETNEDFYSGIEQVFDINRLELNDFLYAHIKKYPLEQTPYSPVENPAYDQGKW